MAKQRVHEITSQPARRPRVVQSSAETTSQNTQPRTYRRATNSRGRSVNVADYSPVRAGEKTTSSGVGTLEAEFLVGLALLILLLFSGSGSYSDKIMSTMKRGALMCLTFFVLAIVSSAGPNAAKVSKALGALIIIAILVTSDMQTVFTDLDNIIKNDWAGSTETGGNSSASADTGTQSSQPASGGSISKAEQSFINSLKLQLSEQGQSASKGPLDIKTNVGNALANTLNGIIPGSGDVIKKLFGL